ncbi:polysaccharide pyruvyl transferase family protein [Demequina pelophila]|uniref:polysaccharide pyruvyl transferase family protein n=1 Tax=Demequina pelophila TaxID=1638984 RepID=UPI000784E64B|nr:polysaccharide pyruvyl transferase family protein [Demequina pelophila]
MRSVALLDTSLDSNNAGDQIIVDSILREIPELRSAPRLPTHRPMSPEELEVATAAEILVFTGTNVLSSSIGRHRQWQLSEPEQRALEGKVVFLGVGWWQYEPEFSSDGADSVRRLAFAGLPVSVRDDHSAQMLQSQGIAAVNTNCPTMWSLGRDQPHPGAGKECVATVTDYRPSPVQDRLMMAALARHYSKVLVWPQGTRDRSYIEKLRLGRNFEVLEMGVQSFEDAVRGRDYVGTRLHAGMRAAQLSSPALIVAIDNRAAEIARDTGIAVVPRTFWHSALRRLLRGRGHSVLELRDDARTAWVREFKTLVDCPVP